jgi:transaldolase/glucose-6-phosphate isomerase
VLVFEITDAVDLGAEFYRWEIATAFACVVLGIDAFDQPDVQDNKTRTRNKITAYNHYHKLDEGEPIWEKQGIRAFSNISQVKSGLEQSLQAFLRMAREGSGRNYVAINAYLPRDVKNTATLTDLRLAVMKNAGCATTLGFGPRFLHSAGQLHKGGPGTGFFLQITAEPVADLEIPGENMTFGVLERFQAARNRRILRLHLASPDLLPELVKAIK